MLEFWLDSKSVLLGENFSCCVYRYHGVNCSVFAKFKVAIPSSSLNFCRIDGYDTMYGRNCFERITNYLAIPVDVLNFDFCVVVTNLVYCYLLLLKIFLVTLLLLEFSSLLHFCSKIFLTIF